MKRDTEQKIITAAVLIFSKRGWQLTTTMEIAKTARVNEVTLFRRFGNKDQLFKAVIRHMVGYQSQVLQQSIDLELPLEQAMKLFAVALYKSLTSNQSLIRSMINERSDIRRQVTKNIKQTVEPVIDRFTFFLKKCQRRGEIARHLNCEILRETFTNIFLAFVLKPQLRKRDYTVQKYMDTAVEIFVKGVRP